VKARSFPPPKLERWRRSAFEVLTAEVAASNQIGPPPPREWAPTLHQLRQLLREPVVPPAWWTPRTAFFGSVETRTDPASYHWDGMKRLGPTDPPLFAFQLTLAGWGVFQRHGGPPRKVTPGTAFVALMPSRHRYYLPEDSPGWTFGWISIHHPYLLRRMAKQVEATGPIVEVAPNGPLAAIAVRLMRGAIKKDFHDRFETELALFEFLLAFERNAQQARGGSQEGQRLLEAVRSRIVSSLPKALDVNALAAEYGMSRSHFSHYFRTRTGLTPARFAADLRIHQATRLLLTTRSPLKQIADACGFANANYFCKVFRRHQHVSPTSYRKSLG
jgi:AraC-like DNA-binding protein